MQTSDNIQTSFKPSFKPGNIIQIISYLLIILWVYAAASKLLDFTEFVWQLKNQVFGTKMALALVFLIPLFELGTTVMLAFIRSRFYGLMMSAILLLLFSGYIILLMTGIFGRVPCACGGILAKMSWKAHLVFNLIFLSLTLSALFINYKGRRRYEVKK